MTNLPMTLHFLERWEQRARRRSVAPPPCGPSGPEHPHPRGPQDAGKRRRRGFSLIELLIVVAIIGVLASLVIAQISNASADSRRIVSRQQQVVLQSALNSWIIQQVTPSAGAKALTISEVRKDYESMKPEEKLAVIQSELDPDTASRFELTKVGIQSDAMKRINAHIVLEKWTADAAGYPQVSLKE